MHIAFFSHSSSSLRICLHFSTSVCIWWFTSRASILSPESELMNDFSTEGAVRVCPFALTSEFSERGVHVVGVCLMGVVLCSAWWNNFFLLFTLGRIRFFAGHDSSLLSQRSSTFDLPDRGRSLLQISQRGSVDVWFLYVQYTHSHVSSWPRDILPAKIKRSVTAKITEVTASWWLVCCYETEMNQ